MPSEQSKQAVGTITFDSTDSIYKTHFPNAPVVPGSLVIHAFTKAVQTHFPESAYTNACKFRFKIFLSPAHYGYEIEMVPDKIKCKLKNNTKTIVTGEFTAG